jgi:hypothetical protein
VPPSWKATLGEVAVFAEVARVESSYAAYAVRFKRNGHGEKATVDQELQGDICTGPA